MIESTDSVIVKLNHNFINIVPDVDEFSNTENKIGYINNINSFCKRVDELADKYCDTGNNIVDNIDKIPWEQFKGDSLEVLVEYLIKTSPTDNRIGIYGYDPVPPEEDVGVDGVGIGENKNPSTVQVKFRSGNYILEQNKDHLSNFMNASCNKYGVLPSDNKNMMLITTGQDIHHTVQEYCFFNKVRVLNRDNLREMLDNRPMFWDGFWKSLQYSRQQLTPVIIKTLRLHQQEAIDSIYS